MKKVLLSLLALATFQLSAQELPAPSPSSTLNQKVGLTEFTVKYSRPGVKGRKIYGDLVPFGSLWRTGANKATAISFDTPVKFAGKEVPAGDYSIFTIPNEDSWTFILNKNTELWGTDGYEESEDVLRLSVEAEKMEMTETFTIDFQDIMKGEANLVISWAGFGIKVPVKVDVQKKAMMNIKEALANSKEEDLWRVNRNAAAYYSRNDIDQKKALAFINTSLEMKKDSWYSHFMKGEILNKLGQKKEAMESAEMAMEMGMSEAEKEGKEFAYGDMIKKAMKEWSGK